MSYRLILLPFPEAAIEPASSLHHPGDRGTAAPHIEKHVPAEIEDADSAEIEAENGAADGAEIDPDADTDDPEDADADDAADLEDDMDVDPENDTECDPAAGDPGLRYLPPAAAVKWLKSQGFDVDLTGLRRLVRDGNGPPIAWFTTGQGGWRIRADMLAQWVDWQRFQASWSARERIAA